MSIMGPEEDDKIEANRLPYGVVGEIVAWLRDDIAPRYGAHAGAFTALADEISRRFGGGENGRSQAASDVLAERVRQIEIEGWSAEHDDQHNEGSLAEAAAVYAQQSPSMTTVSNAPLRGTHERPTGWPLSWHDSWYKPKDRRHNLVRAAALLIAEIERLDRLPPPPEDKS